MSFDEFEGSQQDSRPIELYEFALGASTWEYTSGEDAITLGATTYNPIMIRRTGISEGGEGERDVLTITVKSNNPLAQQYILNVPKDKATVTIKRIHRGDLGGDEEVAIIYQGVLKNVGFSKDIQEAEFRCKSLLGELVREVPRFSFAGLCNHVLYDSRCKVNRTLFDRTGTVLTQDGVNLTISNLDAEADGYYDAGYIELSTGDKRLVLEHTGTSIRLLAPFPSDIVAQTVTAFAGCAHSIAVCKTKFNNVINFGGFAFVPQKNPFQSGV